MDFSRTLVATAVSLSVGFSVTAFAKGNKPSGKPFVAINEQIVEVQGEVSGLQDQIDSIVGRVDTIEDKVTANQTAISDLVDNNNYLAALIAANLTSISDINAEIAALQAQVDFLKTQADDNTDAIAANEALIVNLQLAIGAVENGLISLDVDLQGQIDDNELLIGSLQQEVDLIQELQTFQQNLADGICSGGEAVVGVNPDGTKVCAPLGGGGGALSVQRVENSFTVNPGGSVGAFATCPSGTLAVGGGWFGPSVGGGVVISRDEVAGSSYNAIIRNLGLSPALIRVSATCLVSN